MYRDGFFCPLAKMVMGETAEVLAREYHIGREEQDKYALCSQQRAERAIQAGRFDDEIVPVTLESKKGSQVFSRDEHPLPQASLEKMAKLKPVFENTGDSLRSFSRVASGKGCSSRSKIRVPFLLSRVTGTISS